MPVLPFSPSTTVIQTFEGNVAVAGTVVRASYTVPVGKRAILRSIFLANENIGGVGAGLAFTLIDLTVNPTTGKIAWLPVAPGANSASTLSYMPNIALVAGNVVRGITINTAIAVSHRLSFVIEELN